MFRRLFLLFSIAASIPALAVPAQARPLALRLPIPCVASLVLGRMGVASRPEVALPEVLLESETPLSRFQDAIEGQWGFRPDAFTNAFAIATGEIYLMNRSEYYESHGRTIDDSLAHELAHFVQFRYQNADPADEFLELGAIEVQTWFRETVMASGEPEAFCR